MILIGIGGNLVSPRFGMPWRTGAAAWARLCAGGGVRVVRQSRWYWSTPVPASDQPLFVNAVAQVATELAPAALLARLLAVEAALGRTRGARNAARVVDLDLLAYHRRVVDDVNLVLPHPRMAGRLFVMAPLAELAPGWRHPVTGQRAGAIAGRLACQDGTAAVWPAFAAQRG